jgi:hypothetical protein
MGSPRLSMTSSPVVDSTTSLDTTSLTAEETVDVILDRLDETTVRA